MRALSNGLVLLAATALMAAGPAAAASVVNEDRTDYVLVVTTDRGSRQITLRPGQSVRDLCESCEISIEEIGVLTLRAGERAVIRGNTMMIEEE